SEQASIRIGSRSSTRSCNRRPTVLQRPPLVQSSRAGQGQYQKLLARPFMLAAMVLLAAAFSLRFFRMGGVQKMVLGGVASGFMLYIMSKLTDDLSKAALLPPMIAAWMPAVIGAMTGFVALLYQEDG